MIDEQYGKELILDLHDCDTTKFNRESIGQFCEELCGLIDMEACDIHFWDDEGLPPEECQTDPKTKGSSAAAVHNEVCVQFILTSNITIHALELLKSVYLNIFSCKDFKSLVAKDFALKWFGGSLANIVEVARI